ncbi:MAG: 5'-nucleotidase C-terminal domain-containing protein [Bacteroidota bacterium]|nr:5'-nucleotidase C-terminal domain-containing protein [Bacteroidota bacterium]
MKINRSFPILKNNNNTNNRPSFDGRFYVMTDSHARMRTTAGVLTAIENECQHKIPATLIDGGDFSQFTYSLDSVMKVYTKFAKNNPNIKMIFNLGNVELYDFVNKIDTFNKYIKELTENGIEVISSSIDKLSKTFKTSNDNIKPYTIIEDIVDGQKKKVLLTGTASLNDNSIINVNEQNDALKTALSKALQDSKKKPDNIILLSHNYLQDTHTILDYLRNEMKLDNISGIFGGHPHSLIDEMQNGTRILYAPPHGYGALKVDLTQKGIEYPTMQLAKQGDYNYETLFHNQDRTILNLSFDNPLPINPEYQAIMDKYDPDMNKLIAKASVNLGYRKPGKYASDTSEIGTFLANSIKEKTGSDIAILLTMDIRDKLPSAGNDIKLYNVKYALNVDKPVSRKIVTPKDLKDIFEISLEKQADNETNRDFFEFSDNLKIERYVNRTKNESKVKQIYIKDKNGNWQGLLEDVNGETVVKKEFQHKKYSLATCNFVASGGRQSLFFFKTIPYDPKFQENRLTTEGIFIEALKDAEKHPLEKSPKSQIIDTE